MGGAVEISLKKLLFRAEAAQWTILEKGDLSKHV